jgi:hypothetical protein
MPLPRSPRDYDAVLFNLDRVLTKTARARGGMESVGRRISRAMRYRHSSL